MTIERIYVVEGTEAAAAVGSGMSLHGKAIADEHGRTPEDPRQEVTMSLAYVTMPDGAIVFFSESGAWRSYDGFAWEEIDAGKSSAAVPECHTEEDAARLFGLGSWGYWNACAMIRETPINPLDGGGDDRHGDWEYGECER